MADNISRRTLFATAFLGALGAMAGKNTYASACLAPPDCSSLCPFGGNPKGNGTQECDCFEAAVRVPVPFANSGNFGLLEDIPPRAVSDTDGGDATSTLKVNGMAARLSHGSISSPIIVYNGGTQFALATNAAIKAKGLTSVGAKTFTVGTTAVIQLVFTRDAYGRLTGLTANSSNCNCSNCCNCNCTASYCRNCSYSSKCNCSYCDCGDDGGCFIKAVLLTKDGPKNIKDIRVGDVLAGPDGYHTVVGIAHATLGGRKALSPVSDPDTVLTDDHIVRDTTGFPLIHSLADFPFSRVLIEDDADPAVQGRYFHPKLDYEITENPAKFIERADFPPDTVTTTLIVEKGHWGTTQGGLSVLLAEKTVEDT